MPVTAAIKFVQGATVGTPGVALIGVVGTAVVASNGNDSDVSSWQWTVTASPPTSSITPGTGGTGATFTFTPDVVGCYELELFVEGLDGTEAFDFRVFGIEQTNGLLIPPFGGNSGSLNFDSNPNGWDPIMRAWLLLVEQLQASGSGYPTPAVNTAGGSIAITAGTSSWSESNASAASTYTLPVEATAVPHTIGWLGSTAPVVDAPAGWTIQSPVNGSSGASYTYGSGGGGPSERYTWLPIVSLLKYVAV